MTRRGLGMALLLIVAAMLGAAFWTGGGLPADAVLPTHWGIGGEADGFSGKWTALLMPAAIAAGVSLLFFFLPSLEPRREGLERSPGLYLWGWVSLLLMSVVIQLVVVSTALGWEIPANRLITGGLGLMLAMIGNQLGKSRSMYLVGIRTPWTLASEEVWIKTHRLGGKLMVLAGILILAASLSPIPHGLLAPIAIASIALAAGIPIVYSYLLWRREVRAQPSE